MKKLLYFIIGIIPLLVACAAEPPYDTASANSSDLERLTDNILDKSKGTYDMVWIVQKTIVDTATFSSELSPNHVISHLPIKHLFKLEGGPNNYSYDSKSYWYLNLSYIGYSTSNAYLSNDSWKPITYFKLNDEEYVCQIWINTKQNSGKRTTLVYDIENDVWSGTVSLDSFSLAKASEPEKVRIYRSEELNLGDYVNFSFQTTGRKKK